MEQNPTITEDVVVSVRLPAPFGYNKRDNRNIVVSVSYFH